MPVYIAAKVDGYLMYINLYQTADGLTPLFRQGVQHLRTQRIGALLENRTQNKARTHKGLFDLSQGS
jgi:hypothetical protein